MWMRHITSGAMAMVPSPPPPQPFQGKDLLSPQPPTPLTIFSTPPSPETSIIFEASRSKGSLSSPSDTGGREGGNREQEIRRMGKVYLWMYTLLDKKRNYIFENYPFNF